MRRRAWVVLAGLALAAVLVLFACLPELPPVAVTRTLCGDGVIDLDAGEECDPGEAGVAIGCAACRVECAGGAIDRATGHCYFTVPRTPSIASAVGACSEAGAHVATFASEAELGFVADAAPDADFWVGISHSPFLPTHAYAPPRESLEPGWSPTCAGCYAHVPDDAGAIPSDPSGGTGDCIVARKSAALPWVQSACESPAAPRETICEREPVGSRSFFCLGGVCFTVPASAATKRYLLVPTPVRAADAPGSCDSAAGTLVVFDSREEREQIAREVAQQRVVGAIDTFWIGLASDDAGAWSWASDASTALAWGEGEPKPGGTRAFVHLVPGATDSELALTTPDDMHASLCQIPVH